MRKLGKHGCQKLVAMETSELVITWYRCQNIPSRFLRKVVKFGGDSFNRREVIHLQSWRGPQKIPPLPHGLNRVKRSSCGRRERICSFLLKINIFMTSLKKFFARGQYVASFNGADLLSQWGGGGVIQTPRASPLSLRACGGTYHLFYMERLCREGQILIFSLCHFRPKRYPLLYTFDGKWNPAFTYLQEGCNISLLHFSPQ